jgi:HAD superfamily hydrolase (TIGR01509 family)
VSAADARPPAACRLAARAVIFDLDGTLTVEELDFDAIRREIGVEGPILEALERLEPAARTRAVAVLEHHELRAALRARLRPHAAETLAELRRRGVATAVLTRNSRASLETVLAATGLAVDATRTREDGAVKPSPQPVLDLCARLGVEPASTLVVGDYLFDLEAARRAGAIAVLLRNDRNGAFEAAAAKVVRDLREVLSLVSARDSP